MTQKMKIANFIRFSKLRIFHVNMTISVGRGVGGLHIGNWDGAEIYSDPY